VQTGAGATRSVSTRNWRRLACWLLSVVSVLGFTTVAAFAATRPIVPLSVQRRIVQGSPQRAYDYVPTRVAAGYRYRQFAILIPSQIVQVFFANPAGARFDFDATGQTGACGAGAQRTLHVGGVRMYSSYIGGVQRVWRCVPTRNPDIPLVRLQATSTLSPARLPATQLGIAAASARLIESA
jgi:hypothetical protein